jgi:hypothetical protein
MLSTLQAVPAARGQLLCGLAAFMLQVPDEAVQVGRGWWCVGVG